MRIDDKHKMSVAKALLSSSTANIWPHVSDEIRGALLDKAVLDCVRVASDNPITPSQLLQFRDDLERCLREGVVVGKSKRVMMLDAARAERRSK